MASLAVLAAAAAVVSWDAQYVMVRTVKHSPAVAALEAGIPDIGAVIFAALGIALALHGRRAIRARVLNVGCVGISLAMNALASAPGWRDLAIWVMPSAVYALASDTLIGVVRAWVIARSRSTGQALADDEPAPIALIGGAVLWLIRLAVAPASTITGFRRWVIDECPVAPGRKAPRPRQAHRRRMEPPPPAAPSGRATRPGKQARLISLAGQRHDLTSVPLSAVSRIATGIAAEIRPHRDAGNIVACDRYLPSSLVLQRIDGVPWDTIWQLSAATDTPDLAVILNADPAALAGRLAQRGAAHSRFERLPHGPAAEHAFYQDTAARLDGLGWNACLIDTTRQPPADVAAKVTNRILALPSGRSAT